MSTYGWVIDTDHLADNPEVVAEFYYDPIPRLRDASPEHPAALELPLSLPGELALFGGAS